VATTLAGPKRYMGPLFDAASPRHAFALLSPAHLLALANDVALVAPLAFVVLPIAWRARRQRADPVHWFLGVAAAGGLALSIVFQRELGPARDWDILASHGFLFLAFAASRLVRPPLGPYRVAAVVVLAAGLHHLVPWVAMQTRPMAAVGWVERVIASPTQHSPHARAYWWEEIAILHRQRGDADASLRAYQAAAAADPSDARFRVGLGNNYYQRGDLARAVEEFRIALAKRPNLASAHNNLAYCLAVLGVDLGEARQHAHTAVSASPDNIDFWLTLTRVESRAGDRDAARRALDRALQIDPGHALALQLRAALRAGDELPLNDPRPASPPRENGTP